MKNLNDLSKEELEELFKKFLNANNLTLMIYHEGKTNLITIFAEVLKTSEKNLNEKLSEELLKAY
jgi:hypothetical protein